MSIVQMSEQAQQRTRRWARWAARAIALVWAGWWTWFGLASGVAEEVGMGGTLVHAAVPGLFFLVLALLPWRWEGAGGALLVVEALIVGIGYPLANQGVLPPTALGFVVLAMAVPPLVAGSLFVHVWRRGLPDDRRRR